MSKKGGKSEMRAREGKREKNNFDIFPFSLFPFALSLSPSVVVSDFRSKESDVTVMELLRRCFFSLLYTCERGGGLL